MVQKVRTSGKTNTFLICGHFCRGQCVHFLKIPVFLGWILRILWSEVTNNYGIPKIRVFLHAETFEFHVVGELSCWGLELE